MDETRVYKVTGSDDKDRTNFMFAPFPADKNINPKHWESKIQFWSEEVMKSCRFYGDFCISCEILRERFRDENKRIPSGLMTVIAELHQINQLLLKDDFTDLVETSWTQWSYKLLNMSASWVWRKMWHGGFHEGTIFVVKELLEETSLALLETHYKTVKYEKTDNVVPWNVIKNVYKINGSIVPEENLVCIISYLKMKGKCKVGIAENGEKIVKFKVRNENNIDPVSEADFEIVKLKKAIAKLSIECTQLKSEHERLQKTALMLVKSKDKNKAKKVLAQKQKLIKMQNLKQDALFSIKEHLITVQEAETTKMITDAFNSSATLLNQSYAAQGLTVDHVNEVMDKAAETKEMVDEIEDAMSSELRRRLGDDYDLDELEKELEELTVDTVEEDLIPDLPRVPTHSPSLNSSSFVNDGSKNRSRDKEEAVPAI